MYAVAPSVAERFDLLRFAGDLLSLAILYVAAGGAPLEVAVEFDAVRRVDINALHLSAQALTLGKAGHNLERVAEDHSVRPILIVLVELGLIDAFGNAVEVGEQVGLRACALCFGVFGLLEQIVD